MPVGRPALVNVPADLIAAEPEMAHFRAGLAHGTRWIPGCREARGLWHSRGNNRERFAELALLYGLARASDHQLLYEAETGAIHSVDHGYFF